MKLFIDIEHAAGIFRPWASGFYISCIPFMCDEEQFILWFDHNEVEPQPYRPMLDLLQQKINEAEIIAGLNLKHDLIILNYYGIEFGDKKLWCTSLVEYLLAGQDPKRGYGMDDIAAHYQLEQKSAEIKEMWNSGIETRNIPLDKLTEYAAQDVRVTKSIYELQVPQVHKEGMVKLVELQNEFTHCLIEMESNGFKFDVDHAEKLYKEYSTKAVTIEQQLLEIFGEPRLNLESSQQLSAAVFGGKCKVQWKKWVTQELKTKPETRYYEKTFDEEVSFPGYWVAAERKESGYASVDKKVITTLKAKTLEQKHIKNLLLELSNTLKVKETLRGKGKDSGLLSKVLSKTRIVHPSFNQTVTATGRLSSSDPNGQNMPRDGTSPIKRCITSRYNRGIIVQWDLSQIEWRNAAWFSQDPVMIHEINTGVDQHTEACTKIMNLPLNKENRNYAKILNFRMIYGGTAYGFYMDSKMPQFSLRRWTAIVEEFFKKYAGLQSWHESSVRRIPLTGGVLQIQTGRKFRFHKTIFKDGVWTYNERQFKNYPIQGMSGGDILPLAAVVIRRGIRKNKIQCLPILTVHDSLVYDCECRDVERLCSLLQGVSERLQSVVGEYYNINFNVKLAGEIEVGPNYGEMEKYRR